MVRKLRILWILPCFPLLFSCGNGTREAATFPVTGNNDYEIYIFQEDEFDSATFLRYSIKDRKRGILLADKLFLSSTADFIDGSEAFTSGIIDSVLYITYINPKHIYVMFDLKSGKGSIRLSLATKAQLEWNDSLFKRLKSSDSSFVKKIK